MLLDKRTKNIAAFVLHDSVRGQTPVGTAFFVAEGYPAECRVQYAVTAKHLIEGKNNVQLRIRLPDGTTKDVLTPDTQWKVHGTEDVAVMPWTSSDLPLSYLNECLINGGRAGGSLASLLVCEHADAPGVGQGVALPVEDLPGG